MAKKGKKDAAANGTTDNGETTETAAAGGEETTGTAGNPRDLQPGQIIEKKRDGKVIATLRVTSDKKFLFNDHIYESISASAIAAARALGLTSKTLNGWAFWGITKRPAGGAPGTPRRTSTPKTANGGSPLARLIDTYQAKAAELLESPGADRRANLRKEVLEHARTLAAFADKITSNIKQIPA